MFGDKIKEFAQRIDGKIDSNLIKGAIDYIEHNEERLSIEILCDHLVEYSIQLNQDDIKFLLHILNEMKIDSNIPPFKYIFSSSV